MGTRNLVAVFHEGEYRVAQYGQWDGYPEGTGIDLLEFIRDQENVEKLKKSLTHVRYIDDDDEEFIESCKQNAPRYIGDPDNRTPDQRHWFECFITRDLGWKVLKSICNADSDVMIRNSLAFAGDSVFCEWAYVVDFDKSVFEVYKGFNKTPIVEGRFISGDESLEKTDGYEPIMLVKTYNLRYLPNDRKFLADLNEEDTP